jgi:hypothetical protein
MLQRLTLLISCEQLPPPAASPRAGFSFGRLGEQHHRQNDAQYGESGDRDQKIQDAAVHAPARRFRTVQVLSWINRRVGGYSLGQTGPGLDLAPTMFFGEPSHA